LFNKIVTTMGLVCKNVRFFKSVMGVAFATNDVVTGSYRLIV